MVRFPLRRPRVLAWDLKLSEPKMLPLEACSLTLFASYKVVIVEYDIGKGATDGGSIDALVEQLKRRYYDHKGGRMR